MAPPVAALTSVGARSAVAVLVVAAVVTAVVLTSDGGVSEPANDRRDVAPRGAVSVVDHGAVGDGAADDTAALRSAIEDAARRSGELFVPSGTYAISATLEVPDAVTGIRLADGAVIRQTADAPVLARRGAVRHGPLPLAGAEEDAEVLRLGGGGAQVEVGSWLVLESGRYAQRSKKMRLGSLRQVTEVDGTSIRLDRPLPRDLGADTNAWVVDLAPPLEIAGGALEQEDPASKFEPLVLFEWARSPVLTDVELRSCGGSGAKTVGTLGGSLDVFVHDCLDDESGTRFESGRHYGYGVEVTGPTRDLVVTGRAHSVRHAFTTGASWPHVDDRLVNVGEPEDIDVSMQVWDTTSSGLDTHEVGVDVRFHDCSVRDPGRYARAGSQNTKEGGFGIFIRSSRTIVERCEVEGAAVSGIVVSGPAKDVPPWDIAVAPVIRDTTIVGTRGRTGMQLKQPTVVEDVAIRGRHTFGIQFEGAGTSSTVRGSHIDLDSDDKSFAFVKPGKAELRGNTIETDARRLG